jgi:hypothetical protein
MRAFRNSTPFEFLPLDSSDKIVALPLEASQRGVEI